MDRITRDEILDWLYCGDDARLEGLWHRADTVRRECVGDEVHLRGLVEIGNYCRRRCAYCGINATNTGVERYRLDGDAIMQCAHLAVEFGYGTVVMQAGEDPGIKADWLADIVRRIKSETPLAVTLSLGERGEDELALWRSAGADRYLLRFETSNPALFEAIHPGPDGRPGSLSDRLGRLRLLQDLGYEAGSGVMIGIPGQSFQSLADDILLFAELDLDMVGVGPYIVHPDTPMGRGTGPRPLPGGEQVPGTELMAYKVVALTRLACPEANIPSTTALASLNYESGRELGLQRGANVVMPNLTPAEFRCLYEIYPAKACIQEGHEDFHARLTARIKGIGRTVGKGQGGRKHAG